MQKVICGLWENKKWIEREGKFHGWGMDYEEFETGPGNFSIGICEDENGKVYNARADRITFLPIGFDLLKTDSPLHWQQLESLGNTVVIYRAKVFGGWLIINECDALTPVMIESGTYSEKNIINKLNHQYRNSITFIPDPLHQWQVSLFNNNKNSKTMETNNNATTNGGEATVSNDSVKAGSGEATQQAETTNSDGKGTGDEKNDDGDEEAGEGIKVPETGPLAPGSEEESEKEPEAGTLAEEAVAAAEDEK